MFSKLVYRLRHRQRLHLMAELSTQQWLSTQQLLENSDMLTRELAIHAATHVPYYRALFHESKLAPGSLRMPEDWEQVPTLDKDILRRQYTALISESCHAQNSYVNHTGGSTGVPMQFLTDNILHARMGAWLDFVATWAGWQPGELRLEFWGNRATQLPPTAWQRVKASLAGVFAIPVYNYSEKELFQWRQVLTSLRPAIIYGYPSVLADFASWLESEHYRPLGIKGIFSSAEVLYPEQRNIIEKVFGCKVYNQYGSRETPCVACECPEGGMHLFVNWNRVEFLDTGEGGEGDQEIVITPLFNYAQPLLRYRIGDLGRMSTEICPCGRGYPLMDLNVARSGDFLLGADGARFYPSFFTHLMDGKTWVRGFQFIQRSEREILVNVVPDTDKDPEPMRAALQRELEATLKEKMGGHLSFSAHLVDDIDRTRAGKHRYVVNTMHSSEEGKA